MQNTSDTLVNDLQKNTDNAWHRLDAIYVPMLKSYLARQNVSETDTEDIVQEVLVVVLRKLRGFRRQRTGSFRTWLRQIAVNCLREYWRRQRREAGGRGGNGMQEILLGLEDPSSEFTNLWNEEHRRYVIQYALSQAKTLFSRQTWEAFERTTIGGENHATVARELGMSVNAVYIAKSRVIAKMRELASGW